MHLGLCTVPGLGLLKPQGHGNPFAPGTSSSLVGIVDRGQRSHRRSQQRPVGVGNTVATAGLVEPRCLAGVAGIRLDLGMDHVCSLAGYCCANGFAPFADSPYRRFVVDQQLCQSTDRESPLAPYLCRTRRRRSQQSRILDPEPRGFYRTTGAARRYPGCGTTATCGPYQCIRSGVRALPMRRVFLSAKALW